MKRALAERAKQSGLPNGVGPSIPGSETTSSPPPSSHPEHSSNVPKDLETPPSFLTTIDEIPNKNVLSIATKSNGPSVSSSVPSPRTTSSPRPKKRLRDSIVKLDDPDEEDSNASAFFLRHQNRALASELRQLKYQIIRLERERDTRRSQCALAVLNLNTLHATWTQLEEALHDGQSFVVPTADESGHEGGSSTSAAPLSTGSGTSVELVGALFHSLAALGNPANGGTTKKIENGDDMDVDEESDDDRPHMEEPLPECLEEDTVAPIHVKQLDELLHVTDNVAKRASVLQGWIWSLLHRLENGASKSVDVAEQIHAAQLQVAHLKAKNKILKAKMKELSRSRDELQLSDKRVRRGLYRLAAGRDQLKDVLKAIVASDEDKESATEWIGSSLPTLEFPGGGNAELAESTSAKTEESTGDRKESTPISAAELAQFQKKVMELEQIATARDEQIKTVCFENLKLSFIFFHFLSFFVVVPSHSY